jgi:hypothetical protein
LTVAGWVGLWLLVVEPASPLDAEPELAADVRVAGTGA